jgi:catechol 2,3-dioxygenase-like lactoylglutathione lyase family enzyme
MSSEDWQAENLSQTGARRPIESAFKPDAKVVPQKMAHVVIKTHRYEEMVEWWAKLLDARLVLKRPNAAFLTFDDEHHRIGIANVPRLKELNVNANGIDHVAYTYATLAELLYTYNRLKKLGICPRWCPGSVLLLSMYYQDPDGNRVQLQWDVNPAAEQLERFQNDPAFVVNPFGAPFDPEEMLERFESGATIEEMLKIPQYSPGQTPLDIFEEMGLGNNDVDG